MEIRKVGTSFLLDRRARSSDCSHVTPAAWWRRWNQIGSFLIDWWFLNPLTHSVISFSVSCQAVVVMKMERLVTTQQGIEDLEALQFGPKGRKVPLFHSWSTKEFGENTWVMWAHSPVLSFSGILWFHWIILKLCVSARTLTHLFVFQEKPLRSCWMPSARSSYWSRQSCRKWLTRRPLTSVWSSCPVGSISP